MDAGPVRIGRRYFLSGSVRLRISAPSRCKWSHLNVRSLCRREQAPDNSDQEVET